MLGDKIKKLAKDFGYSREKMAALLEISAPTYDRICKSDNIDLDTLRKVCKVFDKEISYFLGEIKYSHKPFDGGKFGGEVEEELRAQIEMLKSQLAETNRNNEFLREMMRSTLQQLNMSMSQLAESLGKEYGDEAKRLLLFPGDDKPNEIKMRA